MQVVLDSFECLILDFDKLKNNVRRSANHSLISHVGVSEFRVAGSAWLDLESELLNAGNDFLGLANVTLPADNFSFSLASWTCLGE